MGYRETYESWLNSEVFDEATKEELRSIAGDESEIEDRFYKELKFGTGGMRGKIGAGTNRMNIYTVTKATQGLADYISSFGEEGKQKGVAIAFDCRNMSPEFSEAAALCLNANGIKTYRFETLRPTPELSYAVRKLGCIAGIVVTASHNPAAYNGYKVYWEDGAQITPPHDGNILECVAKVTDYAQIAKMGRAEAESAGLFNVIGEEIDEGYYSEVMKQSIHGEVIPEMADDMTIVYTPLHGTGYEPVKEVLKRLGFTKVFIEPDQAKPDGNFSTVKSPNPEAPSAFERALKIAVREDADIVLATDPDADRLGVYVKDTNGAFKDTFLADTDEYPYVRFNGNMSGVLMESYVCRERQATGTLPSDGAIVSTIVSSNLCGVIAHEYGLDWIECLTGFKYIGEQIHRFETEGGHHYVFGMEESYGCLVGDYTRDKDACGAVVMLCEVAAFYKKQGKTLCDAMIDLYEEFGYYYEDLVFLELDGVSGAEKINQIMKSLRENVPAEIGGYKVFATRDYDRDVRRVMADGSERATGLPKSDVLYYELEKDAWVAVRPSGTEPKIKFYFGVTEESLQKADESIGRMKEFVNSLA